MRQKERVNPRIFESLDHSGYVLIVIKKIFLVDSVDIHEPYRKAPNEFFDLFALRDGGVSIKDVPPCGTIA
jgi:hypothetical protein